MMSDVGRGDLNRGQAVEVSNVEYCRPHVGSAKRMRTRPYLAKGRVEVTTHDAVRPARGVRGGGGARCCWLPAYVTY